MSPCVTWRGDDQHKELRAKVRPVPADHDRTSQPAALTLTNEHDTLTTGILYQVERPTLIEEMQAIATRALVKGVPEKKDLLRAFM
jgi:hypothetical protein